MFGIKIPLEKRIPGLDLARTIAICLVVFAHSLWISTHFPPLVSWLMQLSGTIGVEIFFVISGFLIGKIILRMINQDDFGIQTIFQFLKRRWFRTLPNYYFVLILNIFLWYLIYQKFPEKIFLYFFYLQNLTTTSPAFFRISWSLAVEQFCYIIGPFSLFFLIRLFPNRNKNLLFLLMSLLIIFIFVLVRIQFNYSHKLTSIFSWNQNLRKVTIYRLDAIYYGFVMYYLFHENYIKIIHNQLLFIIGLAGVFVLHILIFAMGISFENYPFFFNVLFLPLNSISICLMLPFLIHLKIQSTFTLKWITYISVFSYSIYLLHYTIILHGIKTYLPSDNLIGLPLFGYTVGYWILVLVLSSLQYKYFEKPITNLRD
ncbi:acyltransferase [Flavobacterium sp.]|uniref:acyltransferase family protein n=1 Tax=Flavobacterium sp. TaxID=239 RepID=UPI00286D2C84|nr:acyltransferase [Flavobacterium sp.]